MFAEVNEKMLNQYWYIEANREYSMIRNVMTGYFHPLTDRSDWGSVKMAGKRPGLKFWEGPPKGSRRFVMSQVGMDVVKLGGRREGIEVLPISPWLHCVLGITPGCEEVILLSLQYGTGSIAHEGATSTSLRPCGFDRSREALHRVYIVSDEHLIHGPFFQICKQSSRV